MHENKAPRRVRIWLIEDHMPDVFLIEKSLQQYSVECDLTRYADGEQVLMALQLASLEPESLPDLVVLDLNLPKVGGMDVLRLTRQDQFLKKVRVIVLTSSEAPHDRAQATELGADRFITKPAELHAYLAAVGETVRELLGMNNAGEAGASAT